MRAVDLSRKALDAYDALGPVEREACERVVFGLMDESVPLVRPDDRSVTHPLN